MYPMSSIQKTWEGLRWFISGVAVLTALASGVATGQDVRGAAVPGAHAEGAFAPAPASVRALPQRRLPQSRLPAQVVLDLVEAARLSMEATDQVSKPGVPLKIGFSRDVPMLRNTTQTSALMVWTPVPGGQVAAISVTSPDALGVRLGLLVEKLPATVLLRFYAQGADQVFEVSGQEITETIGRNLAAGDNSDEARTYWSPVIDGQEITVEIELPAGVSPNEVMFSIPRISHLFSSPLDTRALQEKIGQAGSCNLDSVCFLAESTWGDETRATARMTFTTGGLSYLCTGTLMNDNDPSTYIPYFLTANHCISTQTVASTLQTYWFYRASSCYFGVLGSGILSSSSQTLTGGATLLYASSVTDTSFLRLNSPAPGGAGMSGWTTDLTPLNADVTGIHNPRGDLQKVSFGTTTGYLNCPTAPGGESYNCTSANSGGADHLKVVWSLGVTEPGSSGSGLWVESGPGNNYLVGQLHGGDSSCSTPTSADQYGRFDLAYNAALYQWLASRYTLTVTKSGTGSGAVNSSPAGISCGTDCTESYVDGTVVTLTATPAAGSTFIGWNVCSGTGTCTVTIDKDRSVTAIFVILADVALEGFPAGGAIPAGWVQPSGSNAAWYVTNNAAYAGSLSLRSGLITDSQKSDIAYTASFSSGNVSFARKVSSESGYDYLQFYIDGILNGSWSGEQNWAIVSYPLTAGTHTLLWRYMKDGSSSIGSDAAWIDLVSLPSAATVPGAPTNVVATAGVASATLSFTAPPSTGGVVISGYKATCGTTTVSGVSSPITVAPLNNGTTYACTVKATNSVGDSAPSAAVSVTPAAPVTVPGAPTGVSATPGNASATVSFSASSNTGGMVITSYTVTSNPGGITATGTASPITVSGLTNGTAYTFTVRATNSVGTGIASAATNSVTPVAPVTAGNIDCVFDWMERVYQNLFAPTAAVSQTLTPYYYRYYPGTNAYLGTSFADNQLYYLGLASGNTLINVGPLSFWRTAAGCP